MNNTTGSFRTFYHFRRTLSSEAAHKAIVEFVERESQRSKFSPPPLCMETRQDMERIYNKESTGD